MLALLAGAAIVLGLLERDVDVPVAPRTRGGILLAGAAIFLCSWIPIIAVEGQGVELRSLYVPMLGIAIMGSALANGVADLVAGATLAVCRGIGVLGTTECSPPHSRARPA